MSAARWSSSSADCTNKTTKHSTGGENVSPNTAGFVPPSSQKARGSHVREATDSIVEQSNENGSDAGCGAGAKRLWIELDRMSIDDEEDSR